MKHIRRTMAAEYSRDLSEKVRRSLHLLIAQGFWIGGEPPYGYRRELIDRAGRTHEGRDGRVWKKQQGVHVRLLVEETLVCASLRISILRRAVRRSVERYASVLAQR